MKYMKIQASPLKIAILHVVIGGMLCAGVLAMLLWPFAGAGAEALVNALNLTEATMEAKAPWLPITYSVVFASILTILGTWLSARFLKSRYAISDRRKTIRYATLIYAGLVVGVPLLLLSVHTLLGGGFIANLLIFSSLIQAIPALVFFYLITRATL